MRAILKRIVQAYAPMRVRGLMLDGPSMWPNPRQSELPGSTLSTHQRMPAALAGMRHHLPIAWRKS